MSPVFAAPAREVAERWRGEFLKVMEAMADVRPELQLHAGDGPQAPDLLWWKQPFDPVPGAVLWAGFAEPAWMRLGQQILAAAGIESAAPQEVRSTFLEVLRQSFGSLASVFTAQVGREVLAGEGAEEPPARETAEQVRYIFRVSDGETAEVSLVVGHSLLAALARRSESQPAALVPQRSAPEDTDQPVSHGTLDLLLDVEMPVSVSFGRTQLRLQDVLKLISGSIIELDRAIIEPVEVVVNNCVIARGEVVVVDGNYGVRINEIASRSERIQQSRKYMLPSQVRRH